MKKLIHILPLLWVTTSFGQVKKLDNSVHVNSSAHFTISNLELSDDGRWAAVKKRYTHNSDTILVFDHYVPKLPKLTIVKMNQQLSFFKDNTMLVSGNGKAKWIDPLTLNQRQYSDVKQADVLRAQNRYFIWGKDGTLTIYNTNGKAINSIRNLQKYISDKETQLYVIHKDNRTSTITDFSGIDASVLYSTEYEIKRMELIGANQILLTEIEEGSSNVKLVLINPHTKEIVRQMVNTSKDLNFIGVTEIQKGKMYLVDCLKTVKLKGQEPTPVDIWYGKDNNLKAKKYGTEEFHDYFLWNVNSKELSSLFNENSLSFASMNHPRYLLGFIPDENYNYVTRYPELNLYLYDILDRTFFQIIDRASNIVISPRGDYIISLNEKSSKWIIFNTKTKESHILENIDLEKPVFDTSEPNVYFGSKNGLWKYDIKNQKLISFKVTKGKEVSIIKANNFRVSNQFDVRSSSINFSQPILLKLQDKNNKSSYSFFANGGFKEVLLPTKNNIKELKLDKNLTIAYSIEENFNMPTKVFSTTLRHAKKQVVYEGNINDKESLELRQEIVNYKNSEGISLKGVLYFPVNFDSSKRYPLIVHIYQIQSTEANEYSYSTIDGVGFNLRELLRRGYFVYFPDIVFDSRGTGLSALDCVNKALNAVNNNSSIDTENIGLTGHSMGGYETNFIATHSNRFKTYISSSGHSDILRAYFSYSYDNYIPLLWQFETGQYKMNKSFSENKELYFLNNPIHYVDKVKSPILLWTGMKDENVRWDHTMEFYLGLKRNGKNVIALFYPTQGHIMDINSDECIDLNIRVLEWWDYFLKDKNGVPWINKQMNVAQKAQ